MVVMHVVVDGNQCQANHAADHCTHRAAGDCADHCAQPPDARAAASNVVYVDPVRGTDTGDGSAAKPYRDLNALLDPARGYLATSINTAGRNGLSLRPVNADARIRPGATIMLMSGNYGSLDIANVYNDSFLTIRAAPGAEPVFTQITIRAGRKFVFDGLTLRLSADAHIAAPLTATLFAARASTLGPVSDVVVENSSFATVPDSSRFTAEDWKNLNTDAVMLLDVNCARVANNRISNVRRGINNGAQYATVSGNSISDFSGDGIRFLTSHQEYTANVIRSSRNTLIDPDHPDAMQGFAYEPGKQLREARATDITISGNVIYDPIRPGYDAVQGISYFDGIFSNVSIFDNFVRTNSVHGISAYGGDKIVIAYNTVISPALGYAGYTSIKLVASKTGALPVNSAVVNNAADRIDVAPGVTVAGNAVLRTRSAKHAYGSVMLSAEIDRWFADPAKGDFSPKAGSPLVDAADPSLFRVGTDANGKPRDERPDIGAFEFQRVQP